MGNGNPNRLCPCDARTRRRCTRTTPGCRQLVIGRVDGSDTTHAPVGIRSCQKNRARAAVAQGYVPHAKSTRNDPLLPQLRLPAGLRAGMSELNLQGLLGSTCHHGVGTTSIPGDSDLLGVVIGWDTYQDEAFVLYLDPIAFTIHQWKLHEARFVLRQCSGLNNE